MLYNICISCYTNNYLVGIGGGDMNQWECSKCRYIFQAELPPEKCPSCQEACTFVNVTCYTPDCGGPGNIDPQLVKQKE